MNGLHIFMIMKLLGHVIYFEFFRQDLAAE